MKINDYFYIIKQSKPTIMSNQKITRKVSKKELLEVAAENRAAKRTKNYDGIDYQVPFYSNVEDEMYALYEYARKFPNFEDDKSFEDAYIDSRNKCFTIKEIFYDNNN